MCKIHNTIGSLTTLKDHLHSNGIYEFKSLKEVMEFQKSYDTYRMQLVSQHEILIKKEKSQLHADIEKIAAEIENPKQQIETAINNKIAHFILLQNNSTEANSSNFLHKVKSFIQQQYYKKKISKLKDSIDADIKMVTAPLVTQHQEKNNRYQFIISNFDGAVKQSCHNELSRLERKKSTIDSLNSYIYGALGEQKVVKALESLSDEYHLINDFSISFSPAIYNKQEDDYIQSIQIDHILIAPSGVFLIETKNWSEQSIENLSLRSPVDQIKRSAYVLYRLLHQEIGGYRLQLDQHHWGEKKISIRNLIVLINTKPKGDFQYVKVLTLNELVGYVQYLQPIFSNTETQKIADFLLLINNQKTIITK